MENSLISTTDLQDGEESLGCLNDKPDIPIVGILPTSSTPYSLPQNCLGIVLVDTSSQNIQLAVGADLNNVDYNDPSADQGRQLIPPTIAIPGIFHQIPNSEIEDGQESHVYDGESVCEDSLDGANVVQQNLLSDNTNLGQQKKQEVPKKKGGWPKGKRRKDVPEIIAPKAPPTGYVAFAIQRRAEIKETHPEIPFCEVTKLLGQEWTDLDPDKKQKYLDDAEEAKKKYYEELKIFRESDAYKNLIKKKRKLNENGLTDQGLEGITKCGIETEMTNMYCEICDMCFTSAHNKKEHMFGKTHLQKISAEIQKQENEKQKDGQLNSSVDDSDGEPTVIEGPVDIQGFINSFRAQNHERDQEISKLKMIVKSSREENTALYKQLEELKMYENRLTTELEASKQYCQNIIHQTDTLKMISSMFGAMFGVINFEV